MSHHLIHVVRVALFSRSGEILLLRRSGTDRWKPFHWNLPGGKLDSGEDPQVAAEREFTEETGISIPMDLFQHRFDVTVDGRTTRLYAALIPFPIPAIGTDGEHDLYTWADPYFIPGPVIPGTRELIAAACSPL